jgi:hypothetical protein
MVTLYIWYIEQNKIETICMTLYIWYIEQNKIEVGAHAHNMSNVDPSLMVRRLYHPTWSEKFPSRGNPFNLYKTL